MSNEREANAVFSLEAEANVLGSIISNNGLLDLAISKLKPEQFYTVAHRIIFRAICHLHEIGKPIDVVILDEFIEREGEKESSGGLAYIGELVRNTWSTANIESYIEVVKEKWLMRTLMEISLETVNKIKNPTGKSASQLLDETEERIFEISKNRVTSSAGPKHSKDFIKDTLAIIDKAVNSESGVTGLKTGFRDLDKLTSGLHPSDLFILAGRPSMGKTALAMNIAEYASLNSEKPVLVFSLEMPSTQLLMRIYSSMGTINASHLKTGSLSDSDWSSLTAVASTIKDKSNLFIDDGSGMSPSEMRLRARNLAQEHGGLSLIVVDYLQLMHVPEISDNRNAEIGFISRSLKALAKELECPVIALSQLNRSLEQRVDKRPVMSDLRDSGGIEQDADVIGFVYRDEVYNDEPNLKGKAELIIGKQRNGPTGVVNLLFEGQYTRFRTL